MSSDEIERLKLKVRRDPNSKLFVPLAEAYSNAGLFEAAIEVLRKGLQLQPEYISARVSLGKVYLLIGMIPEARVEFERVVSFRKDNLFAHRKLAEIYLSTGEKEKALEEFRIIHTLSHLDDDTARIYKELESELSLSDEKANINEGMPAAFNEEIATNKRADEPDKKFKETAEATIPAQKVSGGDGAGTIEELIENAGSGISDGKYGAAMKAYSMLLEKHPGNTLLLQRIEELKALINLVDGRRELCIARLDSFLLSIRNRHKQVFQQRQQFS
jgi:tetratricopeptide (TPR) repeat protein